MRALGLHVVPPGICKDDCEGLALPLIRCLPRLGRPGRRAQVTAVVAIGGPPALPGALAHWWPLRACVRCCHGHLAPLATAGAIEGLHEASPRPS